MKKYLEQEIAEEIKGIVRREVLRLKAKEALTGTDPANLEKYAKIYTILMTSHREDIKTNVFGGASVEELENLIKDEDSSDEV